MSPWLSLTLLSFTASFPVIYLIQRVSRFQSITSINVIARRRLEQPAVFYTASALLVLAYVMSLSQWASYDEYSYALGTRSHVLFAGANHFLSHFVAHEANRIWKLFSTNTLLLRQLLNIVYTLLTMLVMRQIILLRTRDQALANLGSLLLGVSFGIWKYTISAEVYPLLLLLWVCALWQGHRILLGHNSWGNFFVLSLFANLAVLAHDMAALMSIAFLIAFLLAPRGLKGMLTTRYLATGLLLLPLFQALTVPATHVHSWTEFMNRHLFYILHPDSGTGDYKYSILTNAVLSVREALFSMFTGIDSVWLHDTVIPRTLTLVLHILVFSLLGLAYFWSLQNSRQHLTETPQDRAVVLLPFFHWLAIYAFALFWRPNDEIQHWFLPLSILCMFSSPVTDSRPVHLLFMILVPVVMLCASGLYAPKSGKLLMTERKISWLKDLPDTPEFVFSDTQNALPIRYYKPNVILTSIPREQQEHHQHHKQVYVHAGDFEHFDSSRFEFTPWAPYPYFYRVTSRTASK